MTSPLLVGLSSRRLPLLPLLIFLIGGCSGSQQPLESILDRIVHIEEELITEVPYAPRWCDRLSDQLTVRKVDAGDCELYVEEEGEGVPLVLINGGPGGTHHYFHPWFSRASRYARVIYYDQRGSGLSDYEPGEKGYSVDQAVGDLEAIRKALGIENWVLLGYSYGGFLAQYYTLNHPENVAGLVLLGASPGMSVGTKPSRQREYLSDEEKQRLSEIGEQVRQLVEENEWSREESMKVLLYNNFINGDWKRQSFLKPSPERMSQIALYEWVQDEGFNSRLNQSKSRYDLSGAFERSPIPTLILEGKWDLTWNEDKPQILKDNHPGAEMVVFENGGHGIYDEEPDRFFDVLKGFIQNLQLVDGEQLSDFVEDVETWRSDQSEAPTSFLDWADWGRKDNEKIADLYNREWFEQAEQFSDRLKVGLALYDVARYEEAYYVFGQLEQTGHDERNVAWVALGMIWQGHMLDLMERREEAISLYQKVVEMNANDRWQHGQFGLSYQLSPWAAERLESPFIRVENRTGW